MFISNLIDFTKKFKAGTKFTLYRNNNKKNLVEGERAQRRKANKIDNNRQTLNKKSEELRLNTFYNNNNNLRFFCLHLVFINVLKYLTKKKVI